MPCEGHEIAASLRSSQRRLDCGNPRCGFARIRCPDCGEERLLSLERVSLNEKEGQVCYRYGKGAGELETMDYLELIARVTSHIPAKGQVTVRYYGLYANAHRGEGQEGELGGFPSPDC